MDWQERLKDYPKKAPGFELDPQQTALVIVDMQYLDAHADYGFGLFLKENFPQLHNYRSLRLNNLVIPNQVKLLDFFRRYDMQIIYITLGAMLPDGRDFMRCKGDTYRELEKLTGKTILNFPPGSKERQILEEIKPQEGDLVINKTSSGAFNSTAIERNLLDIGIEGLVICGVATDGCVINTAMAAADRSFRCILVDDACATLCQEFHDDIMFLFARSLGKVMTTTEVMSHLTNRLSRSQIKEKVIQ